MRMYCEVAKMRMLKCRGAIAVFGTAEHVFVCIRITFVNPVGPHRPVQTMFTVSTFNSLTHHFFQFPILLTS